MDVVHLIAKMEGSSQLQNNNNEENRASNENSFPFNIFRRAPLFGPIIALTSGRNNERGENEVFGSSSIRIISSTYSANERNVEYAPQPTINSDEIRETIAQNLLEVQNMIDYGNYNEFNEVKDEEKDNNFNSNINNEEKKEEFNMNCFDLNKRILAKGQWVDVRDTVDQWLDAQVIEVSEDNTMVKIHYNHWSTRWDEWIQTNSPRIMPFRYHTRQSTLTNYHSPFPNKKPDMGITLLSFEDLNRNSCVHPTVNHQRNRTSSVISASPIQNNNINNNSDNPAPNSNPNINSSNINTNNNTNQNETSSNNNNISESQNENANINNIFSLSFGRRTGRARYAEPPPPIPSPKHQEPDPENHLIKNLGENGFLGVFKEFYQINKVIK